MLHLVLAANLLNAVGGTPRVTETGFVPPYPAYLPDGERDFEVSLQPFSPSAIATFLKIERPALAPEGADRVKPLPDGGAPRASYLGLCAEDDDYRYWSIGEFYRAIEEGIVRLDEEARAEGRKLFVGKPEHQVTEQYYYSGGGKAIPVTDLASARAAIAAIIEQGEGRCAASTDPAVNSPITTASSSSGRSASSKSPTTRATSTPSRPGRS